MHKYRLVAKKGEGTFSEVLKAQCIKNGKYVAIKCMKNHFDSLDQVNNLREIQALRRLSPHANIIKLQEVLYDQPTGRLALVFELMDMNFYELIRGRRHYVAEDRVKNYMYQLMKAMDHMHRNGIFHRDIKPENILIMDDCLKLADFGSCRGIYSKQPYTEYISTRWYRAPECLLTDGYYNYKMDMWGVGCVFFEIMSLFPLFPGTNELDQIQKIHNILGTPPPELLAKMKKRSQHMDFNFPAKEGTGIAKLIPHVSPDCVDLIVKLLAYNPDDRLSARQALRHPYFRELREADKRQKALMNPEYSASLSAQPSTASAGHAMAVNLAAMQQQQHQQQQQQQLEDSGKASLARHIQGSPTMSEDGAVAAASPPETSRVSMAPDHSMGSMTNAGGGANALPSIGKAHGGGGGGGYGQHGGHGGGAAAGHGGGGHGGAGHGGGGGGAHGGMLVGGHGLGGGGQHHGAHESGHHHAVEDLLEVQSSSYRVGLHAESSMDALSQVQGSEGGLPPIGNLSLGKAGMGGGAGGGAGTRRALPNYYGDGAGSHGVVQAGTYGKGKVVAGMGKRHPGVVGGGGGKYGPGSVAKGPGMPPGLVGQVTVAGHKMAPAGVMDLGANPSQSSFKYGGHKSTVGAKASGVPKHYMSSHYQLRQVVGVGRDA